MQVSITEDLGSIPAGEWNALAGPAENPFLRHEFLHGLERHGCLGEKWGWIPRHLIVRDAGGRLVGASPLYLKYNSYGEFVFDWSWADAYRRVGLDYYPKLVAGVPYTPISGPRLLAAPDHKAEVGKALVRAALDLAAETRVSSLHWLFPDEEDACVLYDSGMMRRTGCQFHWHNPGYRDFDDFLDRFKAQSRKKVKRERRHVVENNVEIMVLDGHSAGDFEWETFHRFYVSTFDKRGGYPTLTRDFFAYLGEQMPNNIVLVLARHRGRYVAGALNLRGADALYGRHWGCEEEFNSLHFEACYYTGIDYCISQGLGKFEPGAQGEHKVWRGFEPTFTWSAHWVADSAFARVIGDFLEREHEAMLQYRDEMTTHLPFKQFSKER